MKAKSLKNISIILIFIVIIICTAECIWMKINRWKFQYQNQISVHSQYEVQGYFTETIHNKPVIVLQGEYYWDGGLIYTNDKGKVVFQSVETVSFESKDGLWVMTMYHGSGLAGDRYLKFNGNEFEEVASGVGSNGDNFGQALDDWLVLWNDEGLDVDYPRDYLGSDDSLLAKAEEKYEKANNIEWKNDLKKWDLKTMLFGH